MFLRIVICKYKDLTRDFYQKYSFICVTGLVQRNKPVKFPLEFDCLL